MYFDMVVGNPPYGMRTDYVHLKVMDNALKSCTDKLAFIMPSKPIVQQISSGWLNMFKNAVCNKIEVVDKETFIGTNMDKTAIFYCDLHEDPDNYCKKFDVENNLYNAIDDEGRLLLDRLGKMPSLKPYSHIHGGTVKEIQAAKQSIVDDGYFLNVNRANGALGARWLSGVLEDYEILTKEEEIESISGKVYNIIFCPTMEYGENLKKLLNGVVLRYALWVTQCDRFILEKQFRYVPDVDYSKIHSDEELLKECGFSPEEITKVMDYLNDFDFKENRNDTIRNYAA